jgi:DNA-binding protein
MEKYRLVQEHKGGIDGDDLVESSNNNLNMNSSTTTTAATTTSQQQQQSQQSQSQHPNTEVRITQQGKPRNFISYAMNLFAKGYDTITLKAMGRAINKAVTIAEILKRKMPLHQCNTLSSVEMIDVFEPLEEGLDTVTSRRYGTSSYKKSSCLFVLLNNDSLMPSFSRQCPV